MHLQPSMQIWGLRMRTCGGRGDVQQAMQRGSEAGWLQLDRMGQERRNLSLGHACKGDGQKPGIARLLVLSQAALHQLWWRRLRLCMRTHSINGVTLLSCKDSYGLLKRSIG